MEDSSGTCSWQQKYIDLLEKYNALLSEIVVTDQLTKG